MRLPIRDIRVDPTLQLRDGLDRDRIKSMQEYEEQGGRLPPITVVGDDYLMADGFHRLEAADSSGRIDIEVDWLKGSRDDAIALAISLNDIAIAKPLTRTERNRGVEMLLEAGWTQKRIAEKTGVAQQTITDIGNALAMRGEVAKPKRNATKVVAVLPKDSPARDLTDTALTRIAELPVEHQVEFAEAVAAAGLSEPRTREAIKAVKAGASVRSAVDEYTPSGNVLPATISDVARQAYQRLDKFLSSTMTVDGKDRDFWQVLDVLVASQERLLSPTIGTLADRLTEISTRTGLYAALLQQPGLVEIEA